MKRQQRHIATEQQSFDEVLQRLSADREWIKAVFSRLGHIIIIPNHARVLEIGAAAGGKLVALRQLGYQCEGIEPWKDARLNAVKLSKHMGIPIHIVDGTAESIPYEANTFDIVFAFSVIEHTLNVEQAFGEVYRVLKPGGIFWFNAASSMSPLQGEIRGFPLFGWYPNVLKLKIMYWAQDTKPHLIGHSQTPAVNWFTPRKARTLLQKQGFKKIYDRWDLRRPDEGRWRHRFVLRVIRSTAISKVLADIIVPGCSYAAHKL